MSETLVQNDEIVRDKILSYSGVYITKAEDPEAGRLILSMLEAADKVTLLPESPLVQGMRRVGSWRSEETLFHAYCVPLP